MYDRGWIPEESVFMRKSNRIRINRIKSNQLLVCIRATDLRVCKTIKRSRISFSQILGGTWYRLLSLMKRATYDHLCSRPSERSSGKISHWSLYPHAVVQPAVHAGWIRTSFQQDSVHVFSQHSMKTEGSKKSKRRREPCSSAKPRGWIISLFFTVSVSSLWPIVHGGFNRTSLSKLCIRMILK